MTAPPVVSFRLRAMAILWPAFLMAGVLEMLVFALVDPDTLHWFGGTAITLAPSAVYTLAFFVFWLVIAVAGAMSHLLSMPADDLNHPSAPGAPHWPR